MASEQDRAPYEVHVVLCRPSESRNIGAACRAMKNCGYARLSIVGAQQYSREDAARLAVGATDVLESAEWADSLESVIGSSALAVGVTRRLGQKRKEVAWTPWRLAAHLGEVYGGPAAHGDAPAPRPTVSVVFGNERSGLSDEEIACCNLAVMIPTSPDCPSLNLSHAVQVICYELSTSAYRAAAAPAADRPPESERRDPVLARAALDRTVAGIVASLHRAGYVTQDGPRGLPRFLTDILARASLSTAEARRIEALFAKLAGMTGPRDQSRPVDHQRP